jgi:hypothetical protein
MKKITLFTLSFILSFILGVVAEGIPSNLYYYAVSMSNGKPMPRITVWIFNHFAIWENGGLLCIFILPWALVLLYSLLAPRDSSSVERSVRLLYGFLCFASCEMILFVVILLSSFLPFIPLNKGVAPEAPASAYIPHLLLLIVSAAIVFIAVMHIVSRFRK